MKDENKDTKLEPMYTPFNSFGTLSDDNSMWLILMLIFVFMPSFEKDYDKISAKELEKKVAKLEGKMEIIEKIVT